MQVRISEMEQAELIRLTKPKGRSKWFYERAGISWGTLQKLRIQREAEEHIVEKARKVLRSREAKKLLYAA